MLFVLVLHVVISSEYLVTLLSLSPPPLPLELPVVQPVILSKSAFANPKSCGHFKAITSAVVKLFPLIFKVALPTVEVIPDVSNLKKLL